MVSSSLTGQAVVDPTVKPSVAMLKEVRLLQNFSDAELAELIRLGSNVSFEGHANIIIEGEQSWGIYFLISGIVGIYKTNKLSGDIYDVGQLKAGAFFGEMSLIDHNPRSATVRALTDCVLFYLSKDVFMGFLNQNPDIKLRFFDSCVKNLVSRLRELDENFVISQYQLWKLALIRQKEAAKP